LARPKSITTTRSALKGRFDRAFGGSQLDRDLTVGRFRFLTREESLEALELVFASDVLLLLLELAERTLKDCERPASFENLLGREPVNRFVKIAALDIQRVERENLGAAAAPPGLLLLTLLREKVLERDLQEDPEAPARGVVVLEDAFLEEFREVGLREVPRLVSIVTEPSHVRVERIPVRPAEGLERAARLRRGRSACGQHLRPAGRGESRLHCVRSAGLQTGFGLKGSRVE
jgi:hypothetical protein